MDNAIEVTAKQPTASARAPSSYELTGGNIASSNIRNTQDSGAAQPGNRLANSTGNVSARKSESVDIAANFVSLQTQKEQSNQTTAPVRQLETAQSNLDKMRENLTQIVKMYPPYPKDSSERVRLLSEVSDLQKLNNQLTIPPPYDLMLKQGLDAQPQNLINASDAELGQTLNTLNAISTNIGKGINQMSPAGVGQGMGAAMIAEQQSVNISAGLASSGAGITGEVGRSLISKLIG